MDDDVHLGKHDAAWDHKWIDCGRASICISAYIQLPMSAGRRTITARKKSDTKSERTSLATINEPEEESALAKMSRTMKEAAGSIDEMKTNNTTRYSV